MEFCHTATEQVQFIASLASVTDPNRREGPVYTADHFAAWKLLDGVTTFDVTRASPPLGYGHRTGPTRSPPMTLPVMDHFIFLHERGEETGTNTIAYQGAQSMRLKGTVEGTKIFKTTDNDYAVMEANVANKRVFPVYECRDEQQIKAAIRKQLPDLLKQRARLVKALAERGKMQDFLYAAIKKLSTTAAVLRKFKQVCANHAHELAVVATECAAFAAPIRATVQELRDHLLSAINKYGRLAEDAALIVPHPTPPPPIL